MKTVVVVIFTYCVMYIACCQHVVCVLNVADSYCPPTRRSHVSVNPHMQTLQPSVQIVARHNFAAPTYLNDEAQPPHHADKLWLQ